MMVPTLIWLLEATLKGSVLILAVALIDSLIRSRVDARWRHLLWVIVLLRLVMPELPASSWSIFNLWPSHDPALIIARSAGVERVVFAPSTGLVQRTTATFGAPQSLMAIRWIMALWLAGALFFALRILVTSVRMDRSVAKLRPAATAQGPIPVIECDLVRTPALHGIFRPVLLLPRGFGDSFSAQELRHVMLHELWHLKRMDVAVSWLLAAAQTLHWFNPLVWFAASRIREERELSCDELALSLLEEEERVGYGRTILKLLERFRVAAPVPALVGIVNEKQKMKRRLTMIASFRNRSRFTTLFLALVAAVGIAGLTDAQVARRFVKKLDLAAAQSVEKLHGRISLELTSATFSELLGAVSNKTGIVITQSPEIATNAIQNARFTLDADNVPAHAVLMEALSAFELSAEPTESGVTVRAGAVERVFVHGGSAAEEDVVITKGEGGEKRERILVKRIDAKRGPAAFDENGTMRRELTINLEENGVKSEGKLTLQIAK